MNPEVSFFGVYLPSILASALVAYLVTSLVARGLRAAGFYRYVWHPSLFNVSLFVCLLGAIVFLTQRMPL
jgi:hypothetical protein